ncbi:ferredoxin [Pseudonocardia ailaonensis]|uniref:Ferredoxin n=1 Tax=Pseudonocardia ailaonensis TaxID=367279 RepID=A0ABN2MWN6_9PSEU
MSFRVHVDPKVCQGHGNCALSAPDLFLIDDEGFAHVENDTVPDGDADRARLGAGGCPERAITTD